MALVGCGGRAAPPTTVVRDSAGVVIVENSGPRYPGEPAWLVDSLPIVDIGASDDSNSDLGDGGPAGRLSSGRIVVIARGTSNLRIYDQSGAWIRSVGRKGSGPGEFDSPDLVGIGPGDSILTFDYATRRLSVFDSAGRLARGAMWLEAGAEGTSSRPVAVFRSGQILATAFRWASANGQPGVQRDSVPLWIATDSGKVGSRLGVFPGMELFVSGVAGRMMTAALPFGRQLHYGTLDSFVVVAPANDFSFDILRPNGTIARRVRRPYQTRPVTAADIEAVLVERLGGLPASVPEERKAQFRRMWETAPRSKAIPPYDQLLVTRENQIWIRTYRRPGPSFESRFSLFDSDGTWLRDGLLPPGTTPIDVDATSVLATWHDEDGASHLRVYRRRPTAVP